MKKHNNKRLRRKLIFLIYFTPIRFASLPICALLWGLWLELGETMIMEAESNLRRQRYHPFALMYHYAHAHQYGATSVSTTFNDGTSSPDPFVTSNATQQRSIPYVEGNSRLDDNLRVLDFLVGDTLSKSGAIGSLLLPSASHNQLKSCLVDGALQILDESFSNRCTTFPNHDDNRFLANIRENNAGNHRIRRKGTANGISRLESPNGRIAYLVSKRTSCTKKKRSSLPSIDAPVGMDQPEDTCSSCYLCMLPDEMALPRDFSSLIQAQQRADNAEYPSNRPLQPYCSCQSFLELCRRSTNDFSVSDHSNKCVVICKHLLAIRLLPYFSHSQPEENLLKKSTAPIDHNSNISTMKFVSEEDFSRAILQRILN
jgi:hypothetical protein